MKLLVWTAHFAFPNFSMSEGSCSYESGSCLLPSSNQSCNKQRAPAGVAPKMRGKLIIIHVMLSLGALAGLLLAMAGHAANVRLNVTVC